MVQDKAISLAQRYETGTIDNTKKLVTDGLSEALHQFRLSISKGETIMAKGSVRKKGKKWYYRYYVEDASGNLAFSDIIMSCRQWEYTIFPLSFL